MKLVKLRDHIIDLVEDLQYNVYVGTMSMYNTRKDFTDREIIIEPINIPLQNDDSCEITTTLNIWIALRRRIDEKMYDKNKGQDADWIDMMVDEAKSVYKVLNESKYIRIMARENNIITNYFEADRGSSVNSQSLLRFSLPVKIYNM